MDAKTIKDFFKNRHGLKLVRVRSNTSFVQAWIQSEPSTNYRDPLVFKEQFPLDVRVKALEIIYPNSPISTNGNAGNINGHSMSMHRDQWEKLISLY